MKLVLLNLILAISSSFVASYLVLSKRNRRSRTIAILVIGGSIWGFGLSMEMFFQPAQVKLLWVQFQLIGMTLVNALPVFLAYFLEKDEWVNRRSVLVLSAVPILYVALVLLDSGNGPIFASASINHLESFHPLIIEYTPLAKMFFMYSYIVNGASFIYALVLAKGFDFKKWRNLSLGILLFMVPFFTSFQFNLYNRGLVHDYTPIIYNLLSIAFSVFIPYEMRAGSIFPLEFASILGKMEDLVVLVDKHDRVIYVNPAAKKFFQEFFGVNADDIADRKLEDIFDFRSSYNEKTQELVLNDYFFDISSFTLPDWKGRAKSWGYILRDITERYTLEKKLKTIHLYATQVSNSDSNDDIASVTRDALRDGLGFSEGCILILRGSVPEYHLNWGIGEKTLKKVISSPGAVGKLRSLNRPLIISDLNEFIRQINPSVVAPDNKSMILAPIHIDGSTSGFVALYRPLVEGFLESDLDLLEIFSGYVAAALHAVRHHEAIAKKQEDEIQMILEGAGKVSSMVMHDLRGPLQTIKNSSFIIKSQPEKFDKMAPIIEKSVDYMSHMLEDLRYIDPASTYHMVLLSLNSMIWQSVTNHIIPDNIRLEVDLSDDVGEHMLDKIKIQRMINNLVQNALQAMDEGGSLFISTRRDERGIVLKIRDTGPGIEDMDKLFTPFHTTKVNGIGLGLVSVKQTLDAHNCVLDVESEVGVGTCFTILFPDKENPVEAPMQKQFNTLLGRMS